jgi:hypothetical protein
MMNAPSEVAMPMAQVRRSEALSKSEFHERLRQWFETTDDFVIGPEGVKGVTSWIYVRDSSTFFALHADTPRAAVERYLQLVRRYGDNLQWKIVQSQRGKMTAVKFGPETVEATSFYLYLK